MHRWYAVFDFNHNLLEVVYLLVLDCVISYDVIIYNAPVKEA